DIYGNVIAKDQTFTFNTTVPKPVSPAAYPILNGTILTTNASGDKTHFSMLVRGKSNVKFALYAMTTEPFGVTLKNVQFGDYCHYSSIYGYNGMDLGIDFSKLKPSRQWEQTFDETGYDFVRREVLLAEPGKALAPGLYLVTIQSASGNFQFVLAVSTANITL